MGLRIGFWRACRANTGRNTFSLNAVGEAELLNVSESTIMQQPGLDNRHRDKNGEISRKHGNTLIRTLRETYGPGFAPGCDPNAKLSDCLHQLDEQSLSQLVHDQR
jgi:hypothetical protein